MYIYYACTLDKYYHLYLEQYHLRVVIMIISHFVEDDLPKHFEVLRPHSCISYDHLTVENPSFFIIKCNLSTCILIAELVFDIDMQVCNWSYNVCPPCGTATDCPT